MKKIYNIIAACLSVAMLASACNKKLVEAPHSTLTPEFLSTAQGLIASTDASYAGNRMLWGPQDFFNLTNAGTDEFLKGVDGDGNITSYNSNYNTSFGNVNNVWRYCYTYINTCNAVIDFAPKVTTGIDSISKARLIGECKFLRAQYYFILAQFWGDVTLNLHFSSNPTTSANRAPLADVYAAIVQDLKDAIVALPPTPTVANVLPGKATGAAAKHLLAKVYLTRGWSKAALADDFKNAYTVAIDLISNRNALGLALQDDFAKVFAEGNEANSEVLWTVQHTSNLAYNGSATQNNSGPDNLLCHLYVPQYENKGGMQRDVFYGRPYIRLVPTAWAYDTAFKEKSNDKRYNKTFQTVWYSNNANNIPVWPTPLPAGAPAGVQSGQPKFKYGDTCIYMPGTDASDAKINAATYWLIPPRKYDNKLSPTVTKFFDTKRPDMNSPSIRPIIIYRLAETYLIAAEALLKDGRAADAVPYINAVRERAAYPGGNVAAMDITAADVTLDFILDERTRELYGENLRWFDLARTQTLINRVRLHNKEAAPNIKANKHELRPIPQAQIDAVTTGPVYTQNVGWF